MKKLNGHKTLGLFVIVQQARCSFHSSGTAGVKATGFFLVVQRVQPFMCTCTKNICSVHGNNACSEHEMVTATTQLC